MTKNYFSLQNFIIVYSFFSISSCLEFSSFDKVNFEPNTKVLHESWVLERASNDTFFFKIYESPSDFKLLDNIEFGALMEINKSSVKWIFKEYVDDLKSNTIETHTTSKIKEISNSEILFKGITYRVNTNRFSILKKTENAIILLKNPKFPKK